MTAQEKFEELNRSQDVKWHKRIIQAWLSNIELSIENYLDESRHDFQANKVRSRIYEAESFFKKYSKDINFEFPSNFISTCIYVYSGEKSLEHIKQLGFEIDLELAKILEASKWLPEHYKKTQTTKDRE